MALHIIRQKLKRRLFNISVAAKAHVIAILSVVLVEQKKQTRTDRCHRVPEWATKIEPAPVGANRRQHYDQLRRIAPRPTVDVLDGDSVFRGPDGRLWRDELYRPTHLLDPSRNPCNNTRDI